MNAEALLEGDLLAALRRLECSDPARPRLAQGVRLADEVVRLSQSVTLAFGGPMLVSLAPAKGPRPWRLEVRYPGLFGPNGPLPLHFTEEADRRARHHGDRALREFVDLFNHRAIALFYRAWADGEPAIAGDRPAENPFAVRLGALGGFGEPESAGRDALPAALCAGSPMWFGPTSRSPDGLGALLRRHLGLDGEVVEFTGGWEPLPANARLALASGGRERARLGERLLGRRGWCAGGRFRLVVRTATRTAFDALARAGGALAALEDLVRRYVGDELGWDLELAMPRAEAAAVALDRSRRLGRDCWLLAPSAPRAAAAAPCCRLRLDGARRRRVRRTPSTIPAGHLA